MMKKIKQVIYLSMAILIPSTPVYSQNNVTDEFVSSTNIVAQSVVRILGESTMEKVKEFMAESVVSDQNQVYSVGSGFIITNDGLIATAYHVVAPITKEIIVEHYINNQVKKYIGTLINFEKDADIALIKVDEKNLPYVNLIDPITTPIGQEIGFIGFPLLSPFSMVNKGIVSAKADMPLFNNLENRHILILNAFINHGNSGGPLYLGENGSVIGLINARKTTDIESLMIKLPPDYSPSMTIGGVDPITLSVETYNKNLELIGDVTQLGIGYSASAEYIIKLKENYLK
jgi:S1-C subfamily serine protease